LNVPIDINTAEHYKVKDKHAAASAAAGLEQKKLVLRMARVSAQELALPANCRGMALTCRE